MRRVPRSQRFWEKVDRRAADVCWPWTACLGRAGYGSFAWENGRTVRAHRASWMLHHGEIPAGLAVLHRCDNPRCVNPAHLFLGTQIDNIADMVAKGRQRGDHRPGSKCPTAKLTEAQAIEIKRRGGAGEVHTRLAAEFGLSQASVSALVRGETWPHLGGDPRKMDRAA